MKSFSFAHRPCLSNRIFARTALLFVGFSLTVGGAPTRVAGAEEKPLRIVVIGDSLTEGLGVEKEEAFPALLEKKFQAEKIPVEVVNMGTSGATSASGPSRVRFALKMSPPPKVLFLALGANDGLRGLSPVAMKKNLLETVSLSQAAGMKVFIAGMQMPMNFPAKERARYAEVFKEVARERKTGFLPFLLKGVAANSKLNQPDQIHPTPEGHQRIADHVFPPLRKFVSP